MQTPHKKAPGPRTSCREVTALTTEPPSCRYAFYFCSILNIKCMFTILTEVVWEGGCPNWTWRGLMGRTAIKVEIKCLYYFSVSEQCSVGMSWNPSLFRVHRFGFVIYIIENTQSPHLCNCGKLGLSVVAAVVGHKLSCFTLILRHSWFGFRLLKKNHNDLQIQTMFQYSSLGLRWVWIEATQDPMHQIILCISV